MGSQEVDLRNRLNYIMDWIEQYVEVAHSRELEEDFSQDSLTIANFARELLLLSVSLVPHADRNSIPYSQNQATVVGNAVRAYKLYDTVVSLFAERRGDFILPLTRMISETLAKMMYLMEADDDEQRIYVLIS